MKTPNFAYVRARSLKEAAAYLSSKGARVHAGGTDLLGCLRDGVMGAEKVVSISQIKELLGISRTKEGGLRIGALTTIGEVAANGVIQERYAALARGAAEVGSPQLRNQGTLGGNLCQRPRCWYFRGEFECIRKGGSKCFAVEGENQYHCIFGGAGCYIVHPSDTAPALMGLGASVRVFGPRGSRIVPLEKFFLLPSQSLEKENILAGQRDHYGYSPSPGSPGVAQCLPESAGAPVLGFRPGRGGAGFDVQRKSGLDGEGRAQRGSSHSVALQGSGRSHYREGSECRNDPARRRGRDPKYRTVEAQRV